MKEHENIHKAEKPYVCSLCPARFADKNNLRRHEASHNHHNQQQQQQQQQKQPQQQEQQHPQQQHLSTVKRPIEYSFETAKYAKMIERRENSVEIQQQQQQQQQQQDLQRREQQRLEHVRRNLNVARMMETRRSIEESMIQQQQQQQPQPQQQHHLPQNHLSERERSESPIDIFNCTRIAELQEDPVEQQQQQQQQQQQLSPEIKPAQSPNCIEIRTKNGFVQQQQHFEHLESPLDIEKLTKIVEKKDVEDSMEEHCHHHHQQQPQPQQQQRQNLQEVITIDNEEEQQQQQQRKSGPIRTAAFKQVKDLLAQVQDVDILNVVDGLNSKERRALISILKAESDAKKAFKRGKKLRENEEEEEEEEQQQKELPISTEKLSAFSDISTGSKKEFLRRYTKQVISSLMNWLINDHFW